MLTSMVKEKKPACCISWVAKERPPSIITKGSCRVREEFDGDSGRLREEITARRQRMVNGNRREAMACR